MTDKGIYMETKEEIVKKPFYKRLWFILLVVALIAAAAVVAFLLYRKHQAAADNVYVDTVAAIMGEEGEDGNRYAGVAESKHSWQVNLDPGSSVGEVFVKVGDEVKKGDPIFSYDVEKMKDSQTQAEIDLQRLKNERSSISASIAQLNREKRSAGAASQGNYTIQIQEQELAAKQKDTEIQEKTKELDKIKQGVSNATVRSEIDGVVKSINRSQSGTEEAEEADEAPDTTEQTGDTAFMTIMQTSELQIKATASEQNIGDLSEGAAVIVHSRVDDTTWKGTISKIESDSPQQNKQDDMMEEEGGESQEETSASSYPFYVDLESSEGLMLGQHVYIVLDSGAGLSRSGIWLDEMFIMDVDTDDPYVLAENDRGKLVKRPVTLGQYDDEHMQYEIKSGLTKKDRIAMPEAGGEE